MLLRLLHLSLIYHVHLLVVVEPGLLISTRGQPPVAFIITRYLACDRIRLQLYRSQALSLQLLDRVIHTVAQGKLMLSLLNINVQRVKILNDTACVPWLTNSLYTALIVVAVSALVV